VDLEIFELEWKLKLGFWVEFGKIGGDGWCDLGDLNLLIVFFEVFVECWWEFGIRLL